MWLADYKFVLTSRWTGVANKVAGECISYNKVTFFFTFEIISEKNLHWPATISWNSCKNEDLLPSTLEKENSLVGLAMVLCHRINVGI